jgi:hypothetical protein
LAAETAGVAGLTVEKILSRGIHSSTSKDELLPVLRQYRVVKWISLPSFLTILITGMYLASQRCGPGSRWIVVSLGAFLLITLIGGLVTGRAF